MGTKRVGLARTQALIQNLKRELSMQGSTVVGTKKKGNCLDKCNDNSQIACV